MHSQLLGATEAVEPKNSPGMVHSETENRAVFHQSRSLDKGATNIQVVSRE